MTTSRIRRQLLENAFFIGPIFVLYTTFFIVPLILSFAYSLTQWDGLQKTKTFIGFANYSLTFAKDKDFINSIVFTLKFTVCAFFAVNVIGLLCALAVNLPLRVRNFARTCIYLPNIISIIVVGFLWKFLYRTLIPEIGALLGIPFLQQQFLTMFDGIVYVILVPAVWQSVGFAMLIYLAGLQCVPNDLREVMILDGANAFQRFRHLTLPFLLPSFISVAFTTTTGALKVFDIIIALTGGGPGRASYSIAINIYKDGLTAMKYGRGSAQAIIFCAMVLVITVTQLLYLKSKEVET
jgi:raffinose/stachyose/melibiose transport system permease protein